MGFLNDDTEDQESPASTLVDQQIESDRVLLENKRQSLFQTRLDLLKSNGRESWTPDTSKARVPTAGAPKGFQSLF